MATKTIIRYRPVNPLVGRRELSVKDFESIGIFTQEKPLAFDQERNWWLDADAAGVSKEALAWFEASSEFAVERQEVKGKEDPQATRLQEAYDASLASAAQPTSDSAALVGESVSQSSTTTANSTTTESTATR